MSPRRWVLMMGGLVLAISTGFLAMWLSGIPVLVQIAAWRAKTNASVALWCGAAGLLLQAPEHPRAPRLAAVLIGAMTVIGALTVFEYVAGVRLGLDELLAHDWPFAESAARPNRMSPHAALSFAVLGIVFALIRAPQRRLAWTAQALALAVIALDGAALIGYLYNAALLYRAGPFLRISPYTALCLVALAAGALGLRPDLGVAQRLRGDGIGAYLARRLLVPVVAGPVVLAWLRVQGEARGWWTQPLGESLEVMAYIAVFAALVTYVARSLDAIDARRKLSEQELRRAADLTAALAQARTVEEVAQVTVELGIPALGAHAGSVYVLDDADTRLRMIASIGYPIEFAQPYAELALDAALPICDAVRTHTAVHLDSAAAFRARYAGIAEHQPGTRAWAALPLDGRERTLGGLALSFRGPPPDATARLRIERLTWQCGQALDRAVLFDSERRARDVARAANRAKDEFLAMLGHELRNPLAPIASALDLMRSRDPAPNREREVIERQVRHMTRLVGDLLDVSRIAGGKVELTRTRVELAGMIGDAIELIRPAISERGHALSVELEPGLFVDGDRARLVQVISNLLANAAKFTPAGGAIGVVAQRAGDTAVVRVTDSGVGIPASLLPRVFELFVQGERSLDRARGGLGLGLAIVHSLVAMHGGSVTAASAGEGAGTSFTVTLPLATGPDLATPAPPTAPAGAAASRRVLIVDDNEDAAELMGEALALAGHAVRSADDGGRALHRADEHDPEYVLLDIGLPVLDGYEVARQLRARDGERRRVLVAMTGYGQPEDVRRALEAGFDRHLVKPVSLDVALGILADQAS